MIMLLFVCSCSCPPEWHGTLCMMRYDDCRNAGSDLCVHGLCIDADRVIAGQVTTRLPYIYLFINLLLLSVLTNFC